MTGTGTGPILPCPHHEKESSNPEIGPPRGELQRRAAKRRHAAERDDERRNLKPVIARPCTKPPAIPTAMAPAAANGQPYPATPSPTVKRSCIPPLAIAAATSPAKASSEPTERSMPPVRITKVMPMASSPVIDTCRITLNRLIEDRNRGSIVANSSINTRRKIVGAKRATISKASNAAGFRPWRAYGLDSSFPSRRPWRLRRAPSSTSEFPASLARARSRR